MEKTTLNMTQFCEFARSLRNPHADLEEFPFTLVIVGHKVTSTFHANAETVRGLPFSERQLGWLLEGCGSHPVDPLPADHEEGDPEVIWQQRIQSRFGGNPPQRILDLDATIRDHAGSVTVERVLKGEPGWTIGEGFLPLDQVLAMSEGELEIEILVRVTEACREPILAAGRAL